MENSTNSSAKKLMDSWPMYIISEKTVCKLCLTDEEFQDNSSYSHTVGRLYRCGRCATMYRNRLEE